MLEGTQVQGRAVVIFHRQGILFSMHTYNYWLLFRVCTQIILSIKLVNQWMYIVGVLMSTYHSKLWRSWLSNTSFRPLQISVAFGIPAVCMKSKNNETMEFFTYLVMRVSFILSNMFYKSSVIQLTQLNLMDQYLSGCILEDS